MSAFHHLVHRRIGAIALVLALAVVLGSLCPRGWFICVHEHGTALVDAVHAQELGGCADADCCPGDGAEGCLDLALSLVLDDQTAALPVWGALPAGAVLATLPDLNAAAQNVWLPFAGLVGEPPSSPVVSHICLLV